MTNHNNPYNPLEGDKPELTLSLHESSDEQVSIIIVNKDTPDYLNICLQSIHLMTCMNNYEVVVVDNNSGLETQEYLNDIEKQGIKIVRNNENLWWSEACNLGVRASDKNSKYYIFLHSDIVILNSSWLDMLINISESQDAGLVGVETATYSIGDNKVQFIQEWCMLMTKECFDSIGPWPKELPLVGHAFIMSVRASFSGYKPQCIKQPIIHHYRGFNINVNDYEQISESAMIIIPKLMREAQSNT